MNLALLTNPAPLNAVADTRPAIDSAVRLRLDPISYRRDTTAGVWWPHSRDAAAELPDLIASVDQRLSRITQCVGLRADAWDDIPYRIPARGREVRVDCLRGADPHLIVLTVTGTEPVTLLVVPPDAGPHQAAHLLSAYRPAEPVAGTPEADASAGWENEGGFVIEQDPQDVPRGQRTGQADRKPRAPLLRSEDGVTVTDAFPLGRADPTAPTTVRLTGEIDICTSPALRSRLLGTLKCSTSLLILDLSAVSFCDAAGLAVLVGTQRSARTMGITLALAAPRPAMSKLLHITGLDRSLPMMV
ncbi:STAS domain-containing protein [Nonomuraea sp. NPDC050786]|uniref:STAS domain-containing protein n=1 Tax=Nonomuraea sp. NPDC050786 TaxID=3154840 RepID=UPI0034075047